MLKTIAVVGAALTLAACAKRPDAIAPAAIPMAAYTNLSCAELARAQASEAATLARLSDDQNSAATGDAVGVFLIGVPVSSVVGGDKAGDLAASKSKVEAIKQAAMSKRCASAN